MNLNFKKLIRPIKNIYSDTPIMPLFILFFAVACIFLPNFASGYNLKVYLLQTVDMLVIACGVTFVVLNGGIDFSATSILTLGSVVGAYILALSPIAANPEISVPLAVIAMIVIGAVVGAINGLAVTILKMPSFIATLATQLAFSGIAVLFTSLVTEKPSITGLPEEFFVFGGSGEYFLVPILISLVLWGFSFWLLKYTKFGKNIFATGVNPKTAFVSGINVKKTVFMLMLLSGIYAGIASVIVTARNQVGLPSLGDKMFISIIAAVIVGGTSTAGGVGGFKQTMLGVLFVTLVTNSLNLMGVEWFVVMIIQGAMILISTTAGSIFSKRDRMRLLED